MTAPHRDSGRSPEGRDAQRLGAEHDHAAGIAGSPIPRFPPELGRLRTGPDRSAA